MELYKQSWLFCRYCSVYSLSDMNGNIFYVGATTGPIDKRKKEHVREAKYSDKRKKDKMIRQLDYKFNINLVERKAITSRSSERAFKTISVIEKYWIRKYISNGINLTNHL